jgi:hypothetical protein
MSRLQDFNTVTPTSSDHILIVQSTGQGLVTFGSTIGAKMDAVNPTGTGALSIGRKSGTTPGSQSIALGYNAEASGARSVAIGHAPTASGDNGSFSEGYGTTASGVYGSHAEGRATTASGTNGSHAEGYESTASGSVSHAEGRATTASGTYSHAENINTTASGDRSHVEGYQTEATRRSQHVFGEFNVKDTSGADGTVKGAYIEIVGKGTSDSARSNARTLDWSGNETIAGTLTQSSDERLKNIKDEAIPDVSAVKAVRFTWKNNANRDDSEHIGYLAQDVEKVLPFLVKEDAEGNKVLDYIAFLVAKVDSLEKRIAELEN